MYALKNRKAEWEIKNEILLGQLKNAAISALSLILFLLWKTATIVLGLILVFFEGAKMVRTVGPGLPEEEVDQRRTLRLHEQGPMVR